MTFSILGTDIQTKQPVPLYKSSRPEGVLILGLQGTGKSGMLENLIIDDCKQGTGVCVIDPHGEVIDHVISRLPASREKDVILLDLNDYACPFGINIFSCDKNPLAIQQTVDQVMHIFDLLFDISRSTPLMAQYLRNCTHTIIANDLTMVEIPLLFQDAQFRNRCVAKTDPKVQHFWKTYDALKPFDSLKNADFIINKLDEFLQPIPLHIIGQSKTSFDLVEIMDKGKILLVKLDNINLPSVTTLIGAMLIALLLNAAGSRKHTNLFNVYADEFPVYATEDFVTLIEQARKRRIGLTMAHQNRGQLDAKKRQFYDNLRERTLGAKQKIIFSISGKDAEEVVKEFRIERQSMGVEYKMEMRQVKNLHLIKVWEPPEKEKEYKEAKERFDGLHDAILLFIQIIGRDNYTEQSITEESINEINEVNKHGSFPVCKEFMIHLDASGLCEQIAHSSKIDYVPIEKWFDEWFFPLEYIFPYQLPIEKALAIVTSSRGQLNNRARNLRRPIYLHVLEEAQAALLAKIEDLKKDAFTIPNKGYSYWHSTCIPEIRSWYTAKLNHLTQEMIAQWKQTAEIYTHYHDKLETVDQGYSEPVYNYDLKTTKSTGTQFVRSHAVQTTREFESQERTPRYAAQPGKLESMTDAQKRVAGELSNLPNFTAKVKVLAVDGKTLEEHTIQTNKPLPGIYGKALQDRLTRLQASRNCRSWQDIDDEILKRQAGQPLPPPQIQGQRSRRSGTKQCPSCQTQNTAVALFCLNCGTKLP